MNKKRTLGAVVAVPSVAKFAGATATGSIRSIGFPTDLEGTLPLTAIGQPVGSHWKPPGFDANGLAIPVQEFTAISKFALGSIILDAARSGGSDVFGRRRFYLSADAPTLCPTSETGRLNGNGGTAG